MKKSAVEAVIRGLKKADVSVVCYLPDSLFKELYPALDADPDIRTTVSPMRARARPFAAACSCPARRRRW
jgi:sulfopyruvate decarboxylase TPP-binding subunit